jgi:hypothetical protein
MIVNRRTFNARQGRAQEAAEFLAKEIAAERERGGFSGATRIYTSNIGQFGQVCAEWEYESLAEYEKGWAEWAARPTSADVLKEWNALTKGGGTNEIWNLAG